MEPIAAPGAAAGYGFALVVVGSLLLLWLATSHWLGWLRVLCAVSLVWWCVALVWVIRFEQAGMRRRLTEWSREDLSDGSSSYRRGRDSCICCTARDEYGPWRVLLVFLIVWAADIARTSQGAVSGSRRLAAATSPGKSVEGVAGGWWRSRCWGRLPGCGLV